jgi:hypothetical protein
MTHKAKDLSSHQKMAIESLLGRSIAENEEIGIRTTRPDRKQLVGDWRNEFNSWYISGYELRLPVMAQVIKLQ